MKKEIRLMGICALAATMLASCAESSSKIEYTISFYDGDTFISSLKTKGNETIELPDAPEKEDAEFKGWYLDEGIWQEQLTEDYFLSHDIDGDLDSFAYYLAKEEPAPEEFTISFFVDGELYSSLLTAGNELLSLPEAPNKDNYEFKGWYFDDGTFENRLYPNTYENLPLEANVSVYAYYALIEDIPEEYQVSFVVNGGTLIEPIVTSKIEDEPKTSRKGYTFLGWYFDKSFSSKASFPLEITEDITLYAKWEENEPAGITFTVDGSGLLTAVEGISETNSEVIIPSEVNGQAVKQIGQDLFRDNPFLRKLSIPDGVSLGYRMCSGCASLEEVDLPSGITVIPDYAFEGCASLRSIELPKTLAQIRLEAFSGSGLESLSAPSSLKEIWSYAFKDCLSLAEVDLNEVTSLGDMAFENCALLSSVSLPDSLLELGSYVFSGCSSLYSITMPSQAIAIESTAFYGTGYYNDPSSWDSGVLYVDSYLVATNAEFAATSSYSVKPGTIAIAEKAFANNGKKLESITLPDGLLFIGDGAFSSLSSLKTANIPSSVNRIGYGVFSGTALYKDTANWEGNGLYLDSWLLAVENVKITEFAVKEGTIGAADGNDASLFPSLAKKSVATLSLPSTLRYVGSRSFAQLKVTSLSLPESLQSIGEGGFSSCAFLTSANLGDCLSLVSIGDQAFSGASLSQIAIPSSVLTMGELVFNQNRVDLSISCLVQSKPQGWDDDWAYSSKEGVSISVNWAAY